MGKITLYHGTPEQIVTPTYGLGDDKHDYGRGFYLTEDAELAKEWAVCRPEGKNGWVHRFELDTDDLSILDFQEKAKHFLHTIGTIQALVISCDHGNAVLLVLRQVFRSLSKCISGVFDFLCFGFGGV